MNSSILDNSQLCLFQQFASGKRAKNHWLSLKSDKKIRSGQSTGIHQSPHLSDASKTTLSKTNPLKRRVLKDQTLKNKALPGRFSQSQAPHTASSVSQASARPDQGSSEKGGISELVLSQSNSFNLTLLLPMLANLTTQASNRWITIICPGKSTYMTNPDSFFTESISKEVLNSYGITSPKVRLIHIENMGNIIPITQSALAAGNSHTVIVNAGQIDNINLNELESAALSGKTQGILLRIREE